MFNVVPESNNDFVCFVNVPTSMERTILHLNYVTALERSEMLNANKYSQRSFVAI